MIKSKMPLEKIVTFAVRRLLLIHPFDDGSGRTARLLGQILIKKLTGKNLIFPPEFYMEMNYTTQELEDSLRTTLNSPCSKP